MIVGHENGEFFLIIFSSLSAFSSFVVLLTGFMFPSMRKRLFTRIIMVIAFCDIVSSTASALGFPPDGTFQCYFQSCAMYFFIKASWIWTTLLSYQLHSIFNTGKLAMEEWHMHAVSWSISLASTLLPLSTNQFGRGDGLIGWCFLVGESEPLIFWIIFSFFIIMVVCLILMTYFSVRIFLKYRHMDIGTQFPEVRAVVDSVKLYPIAMILNWTPNLIASTIFNFSSLPATRLFVLIMVITQVLSTQNGVWSAIIFFYKSKEARHRWANFFHWFQPKYDSLLVNVTPEDFPDDSVFSVSTIGEGEDTPVADRVGSDAFVFRPKTLDSDTSSDMGMHRIHSSSRSSSIAASPSIAPCVDWPRGSTTGDFSSVYNDRFAFATSHSHSVDRINTSILHEDLYSPLQG